MAFSGACLINRVGINSGNGRVHFELKSVDDVVRLDAVPSQTGAQPGDLGDGTCSDCF